MNDFLYCILSACQLKWKNGATKREFVYMTYLYSQLGLEIPAKFSLASNGLRSVQVCSAIDNCTANYLLELLPNGHYQLTAQGEKMLSDFILSESEWDLLFEFEEYLANATLDELHFQAIAYLILSDSNISLDDLVKDRDKITNIVRTLVPDYTDKQFNLCIRHINTYQGGITNVRSRFMGQ
jgi:hypothetical protein